MFKAIDKKDGTEISEYHDIYDDINLAAAKQAQQNIQDVIDEWWSNDNLTEEEQIKKNELFPNGKPTADEFLITFVKYARTKPDFKKLQEEIEKKKQKRQTIKDALFVAFIILSLLAAAIYLCILEKNDTTKGSQTETSISIIKNRWL